MGCRASFRLPVLLLFANRAVDLGCGLQIPPGTDGDLAVTGEPFFWLRVPVPLPGHMRLPFCSVPPQAASAAFSQLISQLTDKVQLFDTYQLRVKQKPDLNLE